MTKEVPRPSDFTAAINSLENPDERFRLGAVAAFIEPEVSASALDILAGRLNDESKIVRHTAVAVLGAKGTSAARALAVGLNESHRLEIRSLCASMLAQLGPGAQPFEKPLLHCLASPAEELRVVAALALSRIGAAAISGLRASLFDPNPLVGAAAADSLGYMGPCAYEALADLDRAGNHGDSSLQIACAAAMIKISGDPQNGLTVLVAALQHGDALVRFQALQKIGELRADGHCCAVAIRECLHDHIAQVRALAALTLARIQASDGDSIGALNQALCDENAAVRKHAGISLAALAAA